MIDDEARTALFEKALAGDTSAQVAFMHLLELDAKAMGLSDG